MLSQFFDKLFGSTKEVTAATSAADMVQDPCSRYLEISSDAIYTFGRSCVPGDVIGNAATTPETASMQYCRV